MNFKVIVSAIGRQIELHTVCRNVNLFLPFRFSIYTDGNLVGSKDSTVDSRYFFESGNLRIIEAETTDSGLFMCKAVNTKGAINVTLSLNVYRKFSLALVLDPA